MHHDEEATHAKLTTLLAKGVEPAIAQHGGRIIKNTGDGFLAEFPSAVEAVRAAVLFQARIKELTVGDLEENRIAFRVGINVGDVIVEARTFLETVSTLRRGSRASQSLARSGSRLLPTIMSLEKYRPSSSIWVNRG